ncbi:hypothetical protein F5X96DRAFT_455379 [Biscogniauxia mediterranea]|nr:hypothetical protein F5X96DRAFT_455379 [Biscogniauxia mediterranea]
MRLDTATPPSPISTTGLRPYRSDSAPQPIAVIASATAYADTSSPAQNDASLSDPPFRSCTITYVYARIELNAMGSENRHIAFFRGSLVSCFVGKAAAERSAVPPWVGDMARMMGRIYVYEIMCSDNALHIQLTHSVLQNGRKGCQIGRKSPTVLPCKGDRDDIVEWIGKRKAVLGVRGKIRKERKSLATSGVELYVIFIVLLLCDLFFFFPGIAFK